MRVLFADLKAQELFCRESKSASAALSAHRVEHFLSGASITDKWGAPDPCKTNCTYFL